MEQCLNKRESNVNENPTASQAHQAQLEAAAAALTLGPGGSSSETSGLLQYFGYDDGDAAKSDGRSRMLRAAAKLRRMFLVPVPDAPGLVFFGGEADPTVLGADYTGLPVGSLAGSGLSPQRAFESCVGEGIEYLSQFLQAGDRIERGPTATRRTVHDPHAQAFVAAVLAACHVDEHHPIAWAPVRQLSDDTEAWFPVDLCYRRHEAQQDFAAPLKLSTGCAAGITFEMATLRALLELIERDAMAMWWRGGRRARPIAADSEAALGAAELLAQLRGAMHERRSWLLDITTDLGIPAVAAVSSGQDGYGFAFGLGARLSLPEAAAAAIFEMCQVELSQHVIAAKRYESGDTGLNDSDRRQLRRGTLFDTGSCALLQPDGTPNPAWPHIPAEPKAALVHLVDRLAGVGIVTYRLDLTRKEFGVPVVRVLAPGLQLEPCEIASTRLVHAIAETGGGAVHTGGLPLL